jgi:hypothetical protein
MNMKMGVYWKTIFVMTSIKHSLKVSGATMLVAVILTAVMLAFACPQLASTHYGYLDINNGRSKSEWVSFGRIYRTSVENTDYSKLLKELGIEEKSPDWKLSSQEFGLRRFFGPQFVDYYEGKIEANAKMFALAVKLKELKPEKARELTAHFQELVQKGDYSAIQDYMKVVEKEPEPKPQ